MLPKTEEVLLNLRHNVAVLQADRAGTHITVAIEYSKSPLLQLGVVAMEKHVSEKLRISFHRAETTVLP